MILCMIQPFYYEAQLSHHILVYTSLSSCICIYLAIYVLVVCMYILLHYNIAFSIDIAVTWSIFPPPYCVLIVCSCVLHYDVETMRSCGQFLCHQVASVQWTLDAWLPPFSKSINQSPCRLYEINIPLLPPTPVLLSAINPSNAHATFLQSTRTQTFLKTI